MGTNITAVQGTNISHAMLLDITLGATTYYVSSAYKPITYDGNTYTELGAFISTTALTEDFKTTNGDIQITLSGIPSEADYLGIILSTPVKGGAINIRRAFFDQSTMEVISGQVYERYKGIITNFVIEESTSFISGDLVNAVTVTCASLNALLESRIAGQRTNSADRNKFFPGDISFDRVKDLMNTSFDFGKEYGGGTGYGGGGGGGPGRGPGRNQQHR